MKNPDCRSLQLFGLFMATLVGGCSSSDPEPVVQGGPTVGNVNSTATTGTSTSGVGGATSAAGPTIGTTSVTSGGASSTTSATVSSGVAGASTVSSVTTSGLGGSTSSTTMGTGGTAVTCNDMTGEEFYMIETECVLCHGEDALGVEDDGTAALGAGPEVRHPDAEYTRWLLREGREDHPDYPDGMPAYDSCVLNDQMVEEIIVFLNSFPQPTDGAGLYADYCANCHGVDGRGGVTQFDISGHSDETGQYVESGAHLGEYDNRGEYMPTIDLTQEEVDMIVDYMQNDLGLQ